MYSCACDTLFDMPAQGDSRLNAKANISSVTISLRSENDYAC